MVAEGAILDCSCGLRYLRRVIEADTVERGRAFCVCRALLGEWHGPLRLSFEAEDPLQPATSD